MKRMIAMVVVLLCVTAAAQAVTAVYAEITYPTTTTWRLWVTETTNWTGSSATFTPSGYGLASFAIDVSGVTTANKSTPANVTLRIDNGEDEIPRYTEIGYVGFPNGPGQATVTDGVAQAFAGQDTTVPQVIIYGFGVSAGTYVPPDGMETSAPYSWAAPGAPGSASPGVLAFSGKRPTNGTVSIMWGDRAKANVLDADTGVEVTTVSVVPEPATLALLMLGGLAALRRRR